MAMEKPRIEAARASALAAHSAASLCAAAGKREAARLLRCAEGLARSAAALLASASSEAPAGAWSRQAAGGAVAEAAQAGVAAGQGTSRASRRRRRRAAAAAHATPKPQGDAGDVNVGEFKQAAAASSRKGGCSSAAAAASSRSAPDAYLEGGELVELGAGGSRGDGASMEFQPADQATDFRPLEDIKREIDEILAGPPPGPQGRARLQALFEEESAMEPNKEQNTATGTRQSPAAAFGARGSAGRRHDE